MKFIAFILILLALNSCAEKPEAIEPDKKIHCEHFSKHSRELPVVSSAIEIFEGQQFGGVLEVKGDSVHYLIPADTTLDQPITILAFIDKEEIAPYRELIAMSLPSNGYWIYYACYDTLGNESFLPEFYDVDHNKQPGMCGLYRNAENISILQNQNEAIQILENFFFESCTSDSAMKTLSREIKNNAKLINKSQVLSDTIPNSYKWKYRSLLSKIWKQNPEIQLNNGSISQRILTANTISFSYADLPPLSDVYYYTNYQKNINLISLANRTWNDSFENFKTKYSLTNEHFKQFSKYEMQQIPFQVSSPVVYSYWTNSIYHIAPPPPPPPVIRVLEVPREPGTGWVEDEPNIEEIEPILDTIK